MYLCLGLAARAPTTKTGTIRVFVFARAREYHRYSAQGFVIKAAPLPRPRKKNISKTKPHPSWNFVGWMRNGLNHDQKENHCCSGKSECTRPPSRAEESIPRRLEGKVLLFRVVISAHAEQHSYTTDRPWLGSQNCGKLVGPSVNENGRSIHQRPLSPCAKGR
jgi:hypothetical protein